MSNHIHQIARGICLRGNSILLTFEKQQNYYFLPGGHVESGESMTTALEREFMEELGIQVRCKDLIATFEHNWDNHGTLQHEINHVFYVELINGDGGLQSQVDHLSFSWLPITKLTTLRFLPAQLLQTILESISGATPPNLDSTLRKKL